MNTRDFAWRKTGVTVIGAIALIAGPAGQAAASSGAQSEGVHPATRAGIMKAMQGEALAYAKYRAYAAQAGRERMPDVETLYENTAKSELREHLTEQARLIGLVRDNAANLRAAIAGESYEARTMYRDFAAQAKADGDKAAAAVFTEIAGDEAGHRDRFTRALTAITNPALRATVPTDVRAEPMTIPAGKPQVSAQRTMRNLQTAMRGEALANAKYTLYGDRAGESGHPRLATLFHRTAEVERTEHFAEEGRLAGLVRDTTRNLCETIAGETHEGKRMYPELARQAAAAGDKEAARLLSDTARDELRHAQAFSKALTVHGASCPTPG